MTWIDWISLIIAIPVSMWFTIRLLRFVIILFHKYYKGNGPDQEDNS